MAAEPHQELIIIKRHGGHGDGHHGGAWKIAFADFMTAMMALFLVLWLISATNPKQRIVIAHYFNPVKLAEVSINKKGLDDPSPGEGGHGGPRSGETYEKVLDLPPLQEKRSLFNKGEPQATHEEATLFRDPYAILSEIAAEPQPVPEKKIAQAFDMQADAKPSETTDNFRDPFSTVPTAAPQQGAVEAKATVNEDTTPAIPQTTGEDIKASGQAPMSKSINVTPPPAASFASPPPAHSLPPSPAPAKEKTPAPQKDIAKGIAPTKPTVESKPTPEQQAAADAQANEAEANQLRDQITTAMHQDVVSAGSPNIEVKGTAEGVLISLTDESTYSMFAVGSAEPQSKTIEVMSKVAQLLKTYPGQIVVRGHTDGRPYKSTNYDNWQLSAARAQMAHYMLVRGGLEEKRIDRIEGYADHQLKLSADPLAAENRRIEILLRKDKP
jgi:chemotaxis protein MotB